MINPQDKSNSLEHKLFIDLDKKEITGKTTRNIFITMSAQAFRLVLSIGSTLILARILRPEDFGLIAMVAVLVNFVSIFKDAGLAQATVQRQKITQEQISNLFWINMAISIGLGLIVMACAPLIAWIYDDSRLVSLSIALAIPIMLSGTGFQHRALLQRNMHFTAIVRIDLLSFAFSIIVGTYSALNGMSYWSLVIMQLVNALTMNILLWEKTKWKPSWICWNTNVSNMLKFGAHLSGSAFLNYISRNADNFLIGKYMGAESLGFYSRAYRLMMMPIRQVSAPIAMVIFPVLSKLNDHPDEFRRIYLRIIKWINLVTTPGIIIMMIVGEDLIIFLLGNQWAKTAEVFPILAFAALFQPLGNMSGTLLTALGQTERILKWGVFSSILITSSFIIGIQYGVFGIALAYAISTKLQQPILLWYSLRYSPITIKDYIKAMAPGLIVGASIIVIWIWHEFNF